MILLSEMISVFESELLSQYAGKLLPGYKRALAIMQDCRTTASPMMLTQCLACNARALLPHSCGHRSCPHWQHYESQRWLERQRRKLLPVNYFMITFTLPAQMRYLAWQHQRLIYDLLFKISWETLSSFGRIDKQLQGKLGATAVLHTHSRRLDYHPHVHIIVPAGALDSNRKLWRKKKGKYLFNQDNLAHVYRAKWFQALQDNGIQIHAKLPADWVVDCKLVGSGDKALTYLARYLYRGVLSEKNILSVKDGKVTFCYTENTGITKTRILPGEKFLWVLLQHVLPKGFRRARDYGFLHANRKSLIRLIQLLFQVTIQSLNETPGATILCKHCGGPMTIIATRLRIHCRNTKLSSVSTV